MHLNLFIKICVGEWEEKYNTYVDMWFTMLIVIKISALLILTKARKEIIKTFSKALRLLRNVSGVQLICAVFTHLLIIKELSLNG